VRIVSLHVDVVDLDGVIREVSELRAAGGGYVCVSTVHMVMEAHDDGEYQTKVNNADLVIPDGMPLVWMQKLQGRKDAARVRGNDLTRAVCAYAAANGLTVGFYGGTQSVIDQIRERAATELPDLKIVYTYSPPFRPLTIEEDSDVVDSINASDPDFLFVGLGCPKQEKWMATMKGKINAIMLGMGGAFLLYAGVDSRAPKWMRDLSLEWAYRFALEPRRLWKRYLLTNTTFLWLSATERFRKRKGA
jgi:N-acetylglucosaminyldiphosphoundecaprenol N-acetyl-beta-D-mannosaminyltransferase